MTAFEIVAGHNGLCPCGTYIRAGVSTIAALDVPLPPDPAVCVRSHGKWYIGGSADAGHIRPRNWLHARCAAKLHGLSFRELELLADDRRAELAAKRRRADEEHGRRIGRQRRTRSKATRSSAEEESP
jgi:hypothetical protein